MSEGPGLDILLPASLWPFGPFRRQKRAAAARRAVAVHTRPPSRHSPSLRNGGWDAPARTTRRPVHARRCSRPSPTVAASSSWTRRSPAGAPHARLAESRLSRPSGSPNGADASRTPFGVGGGDRGVWMSESLPATPPPLSARWSAAAGGVDSGLSCPAGTVRPRRPPVKAVIRANRAGSNLRIRQGSGRRRLGEGVCHKLPGGGEDVGRKAAP